MQIEIIRGDDTLTLVPLLIDQAAHDNFTAIAINVFFSNLVQEHLEMGLLLSVGCSEEITFIFDVETRSLT